MAPSEHKTILADSRVRVAYCDQCQFNLRDKAGVPTQKPTAFVCSHELLAAPLRRYCPKLHQHSQLAGSLMGESKCAFAQTWSKELCYAIVDAIIKLKKLKPGYSYPAASSSIQEVCKACKSHARRDDLRHIRKGDCRFPFDIGVAWSCPACAKHQHVHARGHTNIPGECQWADAISRGSSSRGGFPKDPRVPDEYPLPEANDFDEDPETSPPDTLIGKWSPVSDLRLLTELDSIRQVEGYHKLAAGPASVASDASFVRSPEPRHTVAQLPTRSVFGFFPDLPTKYGNWWQLQNNVPSGKRDNIGYNVPILVHIFHPSDIVDSSPFKEKSDVEDLPAPKRRQIVPFIPAEAREGEEEPPPEVLAVPAAAPEDGVLAVSPDPDWTSFDLGKALRNLRSANTPTIVRQLRILHLRWWHVKSAKMQALLTAAGLPRTVTDMVPSVIDTCRVCRQWQRNGKDAITSSRLSIEFNANIQCDLLFIGTLIILHLVDEATRWSAAELVKGKTTNDLIPTIIRIWFRLFGPPKTITADHEGSLCSEEASIAFERWGVSFKPKPVGSHAYIVERHNELLRTQFKHVKAQCILEGLQVDDSEILSEALYSKNTMLSIHGKSPYQAVIGRTPPILGDFEQQTVSAIDDSTGSLSRHATRLREISLQAMVEGTAQDRLRRAAASSTRTSGELLNLKAGDSVDVFRSPANKDSTGWRGPATVMGTQNITDGYVDVKWGGRAMSVRVADMRRSLVYVSLLDNDLPQLRVLIDHLQTLHNTMQTLACVHGPTGWTLSKAARENPLIFRSGVFLGCNVFHIRCVGIRLGKGVATLRGQDNVNNCILMWWPQSVSANYKTLLHSGSMNLNLKQVFGEAWETMEWVQFMGIGEEESVAVRRIIDDPMLGDLFVEPQGPAPPDPPRLDPIRENDEEMDDPDEGMEQAMQQPPQPPPQPPQRPPPLRRQPQVRPKATPIAPPRSRERTPVPTDTTTSTSTRQPTASAASSAQTWTSAEALPAGWKREHRRPGLEPKRRQQPPKQATPVPSNQTSTSNSTSTNSAPPTFPKQPKSSPAASSWQIPMAPTQVEPNQVPVDSDSDLESDASTIVERSEQYYNKVLNPPVSENYQNHRKHAPALFAGSDVCSGMHEVVKSQQAYLAAMPVSYGPAPVLLEPQLRADDDELEIEFSYHMAKLVNDCPAMEPTDVLVYKVSKKTGATTKVIEKAFDILSAQDIRDNWPAVEVAFRSEVKSFKANGTYRITRRNLIRNICSAKWVVKWKSTAEGRVIKARLTIRGFEDLQSNLDTFSGTASRWGQRIVCSLAVQRQWTLFTSDVATAFLQGLTFEELSTMSDAPIRQVAFVPPIGSEWLFQEVEPNYVPWRDVLELLKCVYGLKDAPRLWRQRLVQVLRSTGGTPLHNDANLFVWFFGGQLQALLSTHVDDLKGCGVKQKIQEILGVLERAFGSLKTSFRVFVHCGIHHEQSTDDKKIRLHQNAYVSQLQPMSVPPLKLGNTALDAKQNADFLSLLGGMSWTTQTRMDTAVFVCALQRAAKAPLMEHATRLNQIVKWARRKPAYLTYVQIVGLCCCLSVSDSAFRREDLRGLAMRGSVLGICQASDKVLGGTFHVVEFFARKQRRVTRSTFSAELNALSDSLEFNRLLALTMTEILSPQLSARDLLGLEEKGMLILPMQAVVDAKSVYDALATTDIKAPSEQSLTMLLCQVKESLRTHSLHRLWWCHTEDMISDGLTKGLVSRQALLTLGDTGRWTLLHEAVGFTDPVYQPIHSVRESITATEHA